MVRVCIETSIQLHAKFNVQGISWWLKTPFQKVPEKCAPPLAPPRGAPLQR